jgi:hypothetical protein
VRSLPTSEAANDPEQLTEFAPFHPRGRALEPPGAYSLPGKASPHAGVPAARQERPARSCRLCALARSFFLRARGRPFRP